MKRLFPILFLIALINSPIISQVHINEYSASNLNGFLDNYGKTEDWIELYNTENQAIDISGYHLSDKESKPAKWEIPAGTIIPANGFLIFWCSGRDEAYNGNFHTNFKLAQTKSNEVLLFTAPDESIIDQYALELTLVEHSRCRTEDGGDVWKVCTSPTPEMSNDASTQFTRYTETPEMNQAAGFYTDNVVVSITNNESKKTKQ